MLGQTWEVAKWKIAQLGGCHLVKKLWEVAAWDNAIGKVPKIGKIRNLPPPHSLISSPLPVDLD